MRTFEAGQVYRIGRAYQGNGRFAADEQTGRVVRLLRPMPPADWYVSTDLAAGLEADWTVILHESRLRTSRKVRAGRAICQGKSRIARRSARSSMG